MRTRRSVFNAPMADEKRTELNRRKSRRGCLTKYFVGAGLRPVRATEDSWLVFATLKTAQAQERSDGNKTNRVYMPSMIPKNGTGRAMKAARIAIARADRLRANKSAAATSATIPERMFQMMMQTYTR